VQHIYNGHHLEQLAEYMVRSSDAGRCHVEFTRICFGVSDDLWNGRAGGRTDGFTSMTKRAAHEARDRRNVSPEIEIDLCVKRRIDWVCGRADEQCMASGCAFRAAPVAMLLVL
jgi:hypothetical protein